jgi:hypothetical protein
MKLHLRVYCEILKHIENNEYLGEGWVLGYRVHHFHSLVLAKKQTQ